MNPSIVQKQQYEFFPRIENGKWLDIEVQCLKVLVECLEFYFQDELFSGKYNE